MHSIAILLCDNDYGSTFRALLESVGQSIRDRGEPITEEQATALIRLGVAYHYAAFQYRFDLDHKDEFELGVARTMAYLSKIRVVFDADADNAYQSLDHDGGSWHLHIPSGQINSF